MSFANQVAVITGASSGIGHALARALAAEGCKVGLVARRRDLLETLAAQLKSAGGTAALAVADVGDHDQTRAAIHGLAEQLGPADLLIANAGVGGPVSLDPPNLADAQRLYRVNVFGVLHAIEAVLPDMLRRGRGHIAAVSSLGAYRGLPDEQAYTSSKAALNNYLEGLRLQLRPRGIAVTTVCPGFIRTPMTDANKFRMPWLMEPDEAARRIVRALRRRRKVYNFPWQTALLMRLTGWLPDWLLARFFARHSGPN